MVRSDSKTPSGVFTVNVHHIGRNRLALSDLLQIINPTGNGLIEVKKTPDREGEQSDADNQD